MSTKMELPVLLINIERAAARRAAIERQASELGIKVEPVPGVDGGLVPREQWVGVDAELFRRRNGRTILPGEYGCYRSHLVAFRQLVDSGRPAALIIEDDVALSRDLMDRAQAIVDMAPGDCLIKLVNHRTVAFRPMFKSSKGDEVGLACFGPMGSSACYLVTLGAARKLLQGMANQSLPLDNALERSWDHGVPVFCTRTNVIDFGDLRSETLIATREGYRERKLHGWRKIPTHAFRTEEAFRRTWYTLSYRL